MKKDIIRKDILLYIAIGCLLSVLLSLLLTGCKSSDITTLPADIQVAETIQNNSSIADLDKINQKYIQKI